MTICEDKSDVFNDNDRVEQLDTSRCRYVFSLAMALRRWTHYIGVYAEYLDMNILCSEASTLWFASCLISFIISCWCSHAGHYCEVGSCASRPCLNGGNCTDLVSGYRCTCPSAYAGRTCATPYCVANNPCRNGGTCHGAGLCSCSHGYTGCMSLIACYAARR